MMQRMQRHAVLILLIALIETLVVTTARGQVRLNCTSFGDNNCDSGVQCIESDVKGVLTPECAYVTCHSNLIKVYVPKGSLDNSSFQASRKLCAETGGYLPPASFDTCIRSLLEKVYPAEQNRASWKGDEHLFKVNPTVVGLDNVLATCVKPVFDICNMKTLSVGDYLFYLPWGYDPVSKTGNQTALAKCKNQVPSNKQNSVELVLNATGYFTDLKTCLLNFRSAVSGSRNPALTWLTEDSSPGAVVCRMQDECFTPARGNRCPATCESNPFKSGYTCVSSSTNPSCSSGYQRTQYGSNIFCADADECTTSHHCYSETEQCVNTIGSYNCRCSPGKPFDEILKRCVDPRVCQDRCPEGHKCLHSDRTTAHCVKNNSDSTACPTGYRAHTKVGCVDDDECLGATHGCPSNLECRNNFGSFSCRCSVGYDFSPTGGQCFDVDECQRGQHNCWGETYCQNTIGGYSCPCKPGFTISNRRGCIDFDECLTRLACTAPNTECTNQKGSFVCACKRGFHGLTCKDVDECLEPGACMSPNTQCVNYPGFFSCECKAGFHGTDCSETD
eukprot:scpid61057/ scgid11505/ Latent-transforming growth factor beta-binding protein 2